MKRIGYVFLAEIVLTGVLATLAGAQSQPLGDYARAVRKEEKKESAKKYDNDNLPKTDNISVVGNAHGFSRRRGRQPRTADADAQAWQTRPPQSHPTRRRRTRRKRKATTPRKRTTNGRRRFADQKAKVDLLSRELDVAQREYRLRAAAFYADAGNRLRNQGSWDKEDAQYKQQIAQKQKAVDDAKKALDDMKEQGRKAGVSARDRE